MRGSHSFTVLSRDPARPGVSVDINVSYLSAVPAGSTLFIEGQCPKLGRRLAFTEVRLYLGASAEGKLVALGRHTKSLG